jgi:hypothetical protein
MLNKEKLNNLAGELWKGARKLCGKFKAYEYQAVLLYWLTNISSSFYRSSATVRADRINLNKRI